MIHPTDEKIFRLAEVSVYLAAILGVSALKLLRGRHDPRFVPVVFMALGGIGLVFLTRFFIYAHPEQIFDRTRAVSIRLPEGKKLPVGIGFAMSLPMFALGCVGLFDPALMDRVISFVSPMRFFLS